MLWWTYRQLKSEDRAKRLLAVEKIAGDSHPKAGEMYLLLLREKDFEIRKAAAKRVTLVSDPRIFDRLAAALRDSQPEVREAVADAMLHLGDRRAIKALQPLLKDPAARVRHQVVKSLDALKWFPDDPETQAFRSVAMGAFDSAVLMGDIALEPLLLAFNDSSFSRRPAVVEALGKLKVPQVTGHLIAALNDSDDHVRVAAVETIRSRPEPEFTEPLLKALSDSNVHIRSAAALTLGIRANPAVVPGLLPLLNDPHAGVRAAALDALSRLGDRSILEAISRLIHDPDSDVRRGAVLAIGKLGDASAIEYLVAQLVDEQVSIRQSAQGVLRKLDEYWESTEGARRALPVLEAALNSSNYWVRQAANETVVRIRNPKAQRRGSIFEDPERKRQAILNSCYGVLKDTSADVRQAAVEALGRVGDSTTVEQLLLASKDADASVRHAAALSVKKLLLGDLGDASGFAAGTSP
jgi:HEAT repeat protein